MRNSHFCLPALCVLIGASAPCMARGPGADVFVNPVNASEYGWNSNINGTAQQIADDFALASPAVINGVTFYGFDTSGLLSNNFTVRIFRYNAGLGTPEAAPFYEAPVGLLNGTDTGLMNPAGFSILEYSTSIPDVALPGGEEFWLTIASNDPTIWVWSHSDPAPPPDTAFSRSGDAGDWNDIRDFGQPDSRIDQAFTLRAVEECPCPEDIDRDGRVAFSDILRILGAWGPCEDEFTCSPSFSCAAGDILDDFPCGDEGCFCFTRFDGSGYCQVPLTCDVLFPCEGGQCPPGFVCVVDDCCGIEGGGCVPLDAACFNGATMPDYPPGTMTQAGLVLPDGSFQSMMAPTSQGRRPNGGLVAPGALSDDVTSASDRGPAATDVVGPEADAQYDTPDAASIGRVARLGGPPAGTLYYSEDNNPDGLYTLSMVDGSSVNLGVSGVTASNCGLAQGPDDSRLFGSEPFGHLIINADGSGSNSPGGATSEGLTFDRASNTLYSSLNNSFQTLDPVSGNVLATLAAPGFDCEALALVGRRIFAIGGNDPTLHVYDIASNTWGVVGDTGVAWKSAGLAYNECEGMLYAKYRQDSRLYRIDPATAATSVVGDTGILDPGGGLAWVGSCDGCDRPCPEDVDRDGRVAFSDILLVLGAWGPCDDCDDCEDLFVDRCNDNEECIDCVTPDGDCNCAGGASSSCDTLETCPDGSCPPGFYCCTNTCCAEPVCLPLCGTPIPEDQRATEIGQLTPTGPYAGH